MATVAPNALWGMYALIKPHLKSMRVGGIVGDTRHVKGGGYHISRDDLKRHGQGGDYSVQAPADRRGPGNAAAAIDITLSTTEMVTVSKLLKAAFDSDDDRIDVLREFIGTVDNRNVCGWNRYRTGRRTGWYPSGYSEASHLWHVHLSVFRAYVNDQNAIRGVAEVICGLKPGSLGWKSKTGAAPASPVKTPAPEDDDMPTPKDLWKTDIIPAPAYALEADPTNPTWKAESFLIDTNQRVEALERDLADLGQKLYPVLAAVTPKEQP